MAARHETVLVSSLRQHSLALRIVRFRNRTISFSSRVGPIPYSKLGVQVRRTEQEVADKLPGSLDSSRSHADLECQPCGRHQLQHSAGLHPLLYLCSERRFGGQYRGSAILARGRYQPSASATLRIGNSPRGSSHLLFNEGSIGNKLCFLPSWYARPNTRNVDSMGRVRRYT